VFDRRSGNMVAAAAGFGSDELAEGFSLPGDLVVQACRRSGRSGTARVTFEGFALEQPDGKRDMVRMANVQVHDKSQEKVLTSGDFDLTEHGGDGFLQVVLYGDDDVRRLEKTGLGFTIVENDLMKRDWQARRGEAAAAAAAETGMPSGRTTYRRLPDIEAEMKKWVADHPTLVKPLTLRHKTIEGRTVSGVEITENVGSESDGKPVFLQMGVHHAREWPSVEMPMEWATDLIKGFGKDQRTTSLLRRSRVILVPVVNPDGYNLSRETQAELGAAATIDPFVKPILIQAGSPLGVDQPGLIAAILADQTVGQYAYKRRNCRLEPGQQAPSGKCGERDNRLKGVDPNRNYGGLWGGNGASSDLTDDTYRGEDAFSEPETRNIQDLVSRRQVQTLITNHTFSNLILRPPGVQSEGLSPDEPRYKAFGDKMAEQNGYKSQYSWQLYDTTGTTEDWSYPTTGGLGFTFEIGPDQFHPPYDQVIAEYRGVGEHAGKGNREAYFVALEHTADPKQHSVLTGEAEPGTTLRLSKQLTTWTSSVIDAKTQKPSGPRTFEDRLDTTLATPKGGGFEWHVNQSRSPFAEEEHTFLTADNDPSRRGDLPYRPSSIGDDVNIPVKIEAGDRRDVFKAFLDVEDTDDYDIYLHKGTEPTAKNQVASGTNGFLGSDETLIYNNPEPGDYVVRVNNFLAARPYKGFFELYGATATVVPTKQESWTLSCEALDGTVLSRRRVDVDRGQRKDLGRVCKDLAFGGDAAGRRGGSGILSGASGSFRFALALDLRRMRRALRGGIRARARCSELCRVTTTLSVDRRTQRRLKLRSAVVARGQMRRLAGRKTFRVRFSKDARRRIVRLRGVRFRITGRAVEIRGGRKVTLRRTYALSKRTRR
jgi:hypothetical protein